MLRQSLLIAIFLSAPALLTLGLTVWMPPSTQARGRRPPMTARRCGKGRLVGGLGARRGAGGGRRLRGAGVGVVAAAVMGLVASGLSMVATAPAQAQMDPPARTLVSNLDAEREFELSGEHIFHQSFTTPPAAPGEDLGIVVTEIGLYLIRPDPGDPLPTTSDDQFVVTLRADTGSGVPDLSDGGRLVTLQNPEGDNFVTGVNWFTVPSGEPLDAGTTYWVTIHELVVPGFRTLEFSWTRSGDESGESDWRIGDSFLTQSPWLSSRLHTEARSALLLEIKGRQPVSSTLSAASSLLSNIADADNYVAGNHLLAQSFATAAAPSGRLLDIELSEIAFVTDVHAAVRFFPDTPVVRIRTDEGGAPGNLVATLQNPGLFCDCESPTTFIAPEGVSLNAGTKYWVTLYEQVPANRQKLRFGYTGTEESSDAGWTFADRYLRRRSESSRWGTVTGAAVEMYITGTQTSSPRIRTLVTTGHDIGVGPSDQLSGPIAQSFTTPTNPDPRQVLEIELTEIRIFLGTIHADRTLLTEILTGIEAHRYSHVTVREDNAGKPTGSVVARLAVPSGFPTIQFNTFTAPSGTLLKPGTTYWVTIMERAAEVQRKFELFPALNNSASSEFGWTLGSTTLRDPLRGDDWDTTVNKQLRIEIKGEHRAFDIEALEPQQVVSNIGLGSVSLGREAIAQTFTTPPGDNLEIELSAIQLGTVTGQVPPVHTVELASAGNMVSPGQTIAEFENPSSFVRGLNTFPLVRLRDPETAEHTDASSISLDAETTYWVVVGGFLTPDELVQVDGTSSDEQTGRPLWRIGDAALILGVSDDEDRIPIWVEASDGTALQMAIRGTVRVTGVPVEPVDVTDASLISFSGAGLEDDANQLRVPMSPAFSDDRGRYAMTVGHENAAFTLRAMPSVASPDVTVQAFVDGRELTRTSRRYRHEGRVERFWEVDLEPGGHTQIDVLVTSADETTVKPYRLRVFRRDGSLSVERASVATRPVVNARGEVAWRNDTVYLEFDRGLQPDGPDPGNPLAPSPSAFSVTVDQLPATVTRTQINGQWVQLILEDTEMHHRSEVTVSYTPPSTNPVQGATGGLAAGFAADEVAVENLIAPSGPGTGGLQGREVFYALMRVGAASTGEWNGYSAARTSLNPGSSAVGSLSRDSFGYKSGNHRVRSLVLLHDTAENPGGSLQLELSGLPRLRPLTAGGDTPQNATSQDLTLYVDGVEFDGYHTFSRTDLYWTGAGLSLTAGDVVPLLIVDKSEADPVRFPPLPFEATVTVGTDSDGFVGYHSGVSGVSLEVDGTLRVGGLRPVGAGRAGFSYDGGKHVVAIVGIGSIDGTDVLEVGVLDLDPRDAQDLVFTVDGESFGSCGLQSSSFVVPKPADLDLTVGETITVRIEESSEPCGSQGAPPEPLTAAFSDVPGRHSGDAFTVELAFSEEFAVTANAISAGLSLVDGTVSSVTQAAAGENRAWDIDVAPDSAADAVTVTLVPKESCSAADAICTADGRGLAGPVTAKVPGRAPTGVLNASVTSSPGKNGVWDAGEIVTAAVTFNREVAVQGPPGVKPTLGITVDGVRREAELTTTGSAATLTFSHTVTAADDGADTVAIVADGITLGGTIIADNEGNEADLTFAVGGPELSVADVTVTEGTDSTADFVVTLAPAATGTVTVQYATADGTATAGENYTATSDTLTFTAGETTKTVAVAVIDDDIEDSGKTFTLTLSGASGATIADASATATILNTEWDPAVPPMARFEGVPLTHDGVSAFKFTLTFHKDFGPLSYVTLRDSAFEVTGASVFDASRQTPHSNKAWTITVEPDGYHGPIHIELPATANCDEAGAICDSAGHALSEAVSAVVEGPSAEPLTSEDLPPAPTDVTATLNADRSITLRWSAPDDDSVTSYQVLRRRPPQGEQTLAVHVSDTASTATAHTDTDLDTRYVYRVRARNANGVGPWSAYARVDK